MAKNLRVLLGLVFVLGGCAIDPGPGSDGSEQPLSDLAAMQQDWPADRGTDLAYDSKADETLPAQFDLLDYQTPVRSQGSRGTCSIFATTALMESLYVSAGMESPDFAEQFLQWSAKVELGAFQNTEGSSAQQNLRTINQNGIVRESFWPYESRSWSTSDDAACTGDDRPVRCYTNGEPPQEALDAQRFTLPRGRWINPRAESIKGHMASTRTPVVVGGPFFYQAWNHGGSNLPTNSTYSRAGYVLSPNDADYEDSRAEGREAGHAFLLVGWDDELEVQKVDGMGEPMVDADGQPVMERGFFLFKNSWGTGSFGSTNPKGTGYGWIAYAYVEEHLTAYVSDLPDVVAPEQCNDGADNDRDGQADCDDSDCAEDRACMDPVDDYTNETAVPIPDADELGASSTITIEEGGTISSLAVNVDIEHTYRGDLSVRLVRMEDEASALLVDREGGSADDIIETFTVSELNGTDAAGTYQLIVVDHAGQDTGTLRSWSLDITRCTVDCEGTSSVRTYEDEAGVAIPDDDATGISREVTVTDGGTITELSVTVDITHTFPADLTIRLANESGREFEVLTEDWSSEDGIHRTLTVPGFVGEEAAGTWRLTVLDEAARDTGTLDRWSLRIATR